MLENTFFILKLDFINLVFFYKMLRLRIILFIIKPLVNILARNHYFFPTPQILDPLFLPCLFFYFRNIVKFLLSIKFWGPWNDVFPPKYWVGES